MILRCRHIKLMALARHSLLPLVPILLIATVSIAPSQESLADDSSPAPNLDLGALANLAQNPQVINIVSSLLNQNGQKSSQPLQNPDSLGADLALDSQQQANPVISQDGLPATTTSGSNGGGPATGEPLRRNSKTSSTPANSPAAPSTPQSPQSQTASLPPPPSPPPPAATTSSSSKSSTAESGASGGKNTNGLGGLMSMLPGLLPNLGNLGNLGSMLSAVTGPKPSVAGGGGLSPATMANKATASSQANQSGLPQATAAQPGLKTGNGASTAPTAAGGGASGTINQVISAYANGQIPSELIQMTMSGKIPSQVIDLALTGQLPPQLIQMVVTGQIPVNTLKALFEAQGQAGQAPSSSSSSSSTTTSTGSSSPSPSATAGATPPNGSSNVTPPNRGAQSSSASAAHQRSMTRALLETLFRYNKDPEGKRSIQVPTLLGSVPVQLPNLPRMRHIGQIVGGTITSVANMIPF